MDVRFDIAPFDVGAALALQPALGVSFPLAQVLVRRGLADPAAAQAFLDADEAHDPSQFAGIDAAVELILVHVARGSRITVHGDYDVDGVCSTAILVRTLRLLGATVDWFLPSRTEDGYGLRPATVERLAARGTDLIVTADCAVTAVEEVAQARGLGMDVVVTDHHSPRADGRLPDAPIVHPGVAGYPCPELCAAGVAHKLAVALLRAAGRDPAAADEDLDLVALATVADCVPLVGENRRLVRAGLKRLAATRKAGLRALMRVAQVDPGRLDAGSIGFRLAPRLNAAGRLGHADQALELVLGEDADRATQVADALDRLNGERRHVEERIRFAAEAQVARAGPQAAYVLAGEGWHPGVIGIVAARIAERHHRPVVLVALPADGAPGTASGRSIPAFDLLAGLDAASAHLLRHGGHRAAAGATVDPAALEAFRAAFVAHAEQTLTPEDLVPVERVDAVVSGDELGHALAEELTLLAPFGQANPSVSLLVPAARLTDLRPMGEGRHCRFTVQAGGVRAAAVAFGTCSLPPGAEAALDVTFALELNAWQGAVEPRLVLRKASRPADAPVELLGPGTDRRTAILAHLDRPPTPFEAAGPGATLAAPPAGTVRDVRGSGVAGVIAALVASGEPVTVLAADAERRAAALAGRLGGVSVAAWSQVEADPSLLHDCRHVVVLDPPGHGSLLDAVARGRTDRTTHLAWGVDELGFSGHVHELEHALREPLKATYRALRGGQRLADALDGDDRRPRPAVLAGRLLAVLVEAGLVELDRDAFTARLVPAPPGGVDLAASATHRACEQRLEQGRRWLSSASARAA